MLFVFCGYMYNFSIIIVNFVSSGINAFNAYFFLFNFLFGCLLFFVGFLSLGAYTRFSSIFMYIISFEIMFLGIVLNFVLASKFLYDFKGQIYALLLLNFVAIESVLFISLLVALFRVSNFVTVSEISNLNG